MLKLKDICKTYKMGDLQTKALKDVSIEFRKSEFVSILGPSGCGKTTLLNIIGGLDQYTSGDLIINGKSTKEYKDKDWDLYRNHSIGFIFQSYNLIPHQTVLENVELALTLSGVSRKERRERAIEALTKVGLKSKIKNKPNQLSGGQMQRVAIARALVNDPEIILADEPTGALDSESSLQVMELLKKISNDRLIIMVTHNPTLAETYSNRIVKLLDGKLIEDSNPYTDEDRKFDKNLLSVSVDEELSKKEIAKKLKKKRMSFFTALSLSFKNLLTKKTRTILTAFAGSIGIIGIALVLAISNGFQSYVDKMQEDVLTTYPITISAKNVDFTEVVKSMFLDDDENKSVSHEKDAVYDKDSISSIMDSVGTNLNPNNLNAFYNYVKDNYKEIEDYVNGVSYTYDLDLEFYTNDGSDIQPGNSSILQMIVKYAIYFFEAKTGTEITKQASGNYLIEKGDDFDETYDFINKYSDLAYIKASLQTPGSIELNSNQILGLTFTLLDLDMSSMTQTSSMSSMFGSAGIFYEMIDNDKLLKSQYELLGENSRYIENEDEALLVLDKNNEVDEYILYALGLISDEQMDNLIKNLVAGTKISIKIPYDQIIGTEYKVLEESDYFTYVGEGVNRELVDIRDYADKDNEKYDMVTYNTLYAQALQNCTNKLKIVGIVRLNSSTETGLLSVGVAYSKNFTEKMLNHHNASDAKTEGEIDELKLDTPETISIYVKSFDSKDKIEEFIEKYNSKAKNGDEITYTDYVGLIMSSVSTIIQAITYVLVAFVSVSLIVSSIMIGIITYISVIERTKEIGVLRSIGASKRDVKRVFTAESFIIGLASGLFGIIVTVIFIIPINVVLKHFTGIAGLASLPILAGLILVAISICLTLIAGLIPAKMAAKRDPVVALRSE